MRLIKEAVERAEFCKFNCYCCYRSRSTRFKILISYKFFGFVHILRVSTIKCNFANSYIYEEKTVNKYFSLQLRESIIGTNTHTIQE